MSDRFSIQRVNNLFKWQLSKMDWRIFALLSLAMAVLIYLQTKFYSPRMDEFSRLNTFFIYSIVVVINFFKQLTDKDSIAQFLLLPSSTAEKFVFLAGGALFIPILYFFGLMWIGDALVHGIYSIPSSYHILSFSGGVYIFFFAVLTFFVHCLKQNRWVWGGSSLFVVLMMIIPVKSYLREHPLEESLADMLSQYLPVAVLMLSLIILVIAYRAFKVNEITRFKNYWRN